MMMIMMIMLTLLVIMIMTTQMMSVMMMPTMTLTATSIHQKRKTKVTPPILSFTGRAPKGTSPRQPRPQNLPPSSDEHFLIRMHRISMPQPSLPQGRPSQGAFWQEGYLRAKTRHNEK